MKIAALIILAACAASPAAEECPPAGGITITVGTPAVNSVAIISCLDEVGDQVPQLIAILNPGSDGLLPTTAAVDLSSVCVSPAQLLFQVMPQGSGSGS